MLLHEHLENKLDKQPDFLFAEFQGKQITYREANTLCNKVRGYDCNFPTD